MCCCLNVSVHEHVMMGIEWILASFGDFNFNGAIELLCMSLSGVLVILDRSSKKSVHKGRFANARLAYKK